MKAKLVFLPLAGIVLAGGPAHATVYLTVPQAQQLLFPGATFHPEWKTLDHEQVKQIEHLSGVHVLSKELRVWRASTGGWFLVDEVVGKHDFIPFALALDGQGRVKGVEILEYREAYGGQIRDPLWQKQFLGRGADAKLRLGKNIRNISGATLSCKHITDGIERLLVTYEVVLKPSVD
jgi:Na+-translocating ferredoxin:NAD+ oxidoreductase RnfG subunit